MSELSPEQFGDFFEEVNGFRPFQWQERLLKTVLSGGLWPEVIAAPTGTGKSNVVDVHVFANALAGWGRGPRVPRRLSVVVNRRAIVDSHFDHASDIRGLLREGTGGPVTELVREGLSRLVTSKVPDGRSPLVVTAMRGGLPSDSEWIDDPSTCAVICATPDMWGSRLLFRGYGTGRFARSREAGLLSFDSVMVLDEAHLNRQLLMSAKRVSQLQDEERLLQRLQVVATTATPEGEIDSKTVGVTAQDVASDGVLAARLERPKPVKLFPTSDWPAGKRPSRQYAARIAELVLTRVEGLPDDTVGCVVNSVFTAREVSKILGHALGEDKVVLWVGPMRPLDLQRAREEHPGAFTVEGDSSVRVIVATQTLEVGIDIDFAELVTELASGPALAQRAGRLNRLGKRDAAPCFVVVPEAPPTTGTGPYSAEEVMVAYDWIGRMAEAAPGIASVTQMVDPPPVGSSRRAVLSRLERGDVEQLAFTSEHQLAEQELSWWLRDDLTDDPATLGIVRRGPLPVDSIAARSLLDATPPTALEIYPVSIWLGRTVIDDVVRSAVDHTRRIFVRRDEETFLVDLSREAPLDLRPGDQLILDASHPIVHQGVVVEDGGSAPDDTIWGDASSVLTSDTTVGRARLREIAQSVRRVADDLEKRSRYEPIADLRRTIDVAVQAEVREFVLDEIDGLGGQPVQIDLAPIPEDERVPLAWIVVRTDANVKRDEEVRQKWSGSGPSVLLQTHQAAVGERAAELGARLGLSDEVCELLGSAGRLHDEGKKHAGFQAILGNEAFPAVLVAKSGGSDAWRPNRLGKRSTLPRGWRHEQLSVALAEPQLDGFRRDAKELVLRLIGTSHGRGRAQFPHSAELLLSGSFEHARRGSEVLFNEGGWEELIEATGRDWGQWGCAYLEAVLRAADCMVSKEGS
ncbi:type I-G CRISPR-associated helicase/endonuclease Cas3g [Gordonia sp. (in: high G+C Gram-positive bacteria)]|uniref:type I-G CRISPR-associated helicase/endonuclease Cas3g n=1 Tax=Gordonia sp. (in: high G+C Gram-positive bacteria) TaxID=84139 RepID=UPI003C71139C